MNPEGEFGCSECWPDSADRAWMARRILKHETDLVDESHFHVMIVACGSCGQRFVSVFTEIVDWADADDSQFWQHMPLTQDESGKLAAVEEERIEDSLQSIGSDRRSLKHDYAKGFAKPIDYWGTGITVGYHD
jgi:hypothetical protein